MFNVEGLVSQAAKIDEAAEGGNGQAQAQAGAAWKKLVESVVARQSPLRWSDLKFAALGFSLIEADAVRAGNALPSPALYERLANRQFYWAIGELIDVPKKRELQRNFHGWLEKVGWPGKSSPGAKAFLENACSNALHFYRDGVEGDLLWLVWFLHMRRQGRSADFWAPHYFLSVFKPLRLYHLKKRKKTGRPPSVKTLTAQRIMRAINVSRPSAYRIIDFGTARADYRRILANEFADTYERSQPKNWMLKFGNSWGSAPPEGRAFSDYLAFERFEHEGELGHAIALLIELSDAGALPPTFAGAGDLIALLATHGVSAFVVDLIWRRWRGWSQAKAMDDLPK